MRCQHSERLRDRLPLPSPLKPTAHLWGAQPRGAGWSVLRELLMRASLALRMEQRSLGIDYLEVLQDGLTTGGRSRSHLIWGYTLDPSYPLPLLPQKSLPWVSSVTVDHSG